MQATRAIFPAAGQRLHHARDSGMSNVEMQMSKEIRMSNAEVARLAAAWLAPSPFVIGHSRHLTFFRHLHFVLRHSASCMLPKVSKEGLLVEGFSGAACSSGRKNGPARDRLCLGPLTPSRSVILAGIVDLARTAARAVVDRVSRRARVGKAGTIPWTVPQPTRACRLSGLMLRS